MSVSVDYSPLTGFGILSGGNTNAMDLKCNGVFLCSYGVYSNLSTDCF